MWIDTEKLTHVTSIFSHKDNSNNVAVIVN